MLPVSSAARGDGGATLSKVTIVLPRTPSVQCAAVTSTVGETSVAEQRNRIGALVAQSYQNGGDLTALNAMMSADGLEGVMDQLAAFQGASTSMQADYKRFAATDALAQVFESKARRAKAEQVRLAARAEQAKQQAVASSANKSTRYCLSQDEVRKYNVAPLEVAG